MTQQPSGGDQVSRIYDSIVDAARKQREAGKANLAIGLLETVIRALPGHADARHQIGLALVAEGQVDGLKALEGAVALDPTHAERIADLGEAKLAFGEVDRGFASLKAMAALAPDRERLLIRFARELGRARRFADAEAWFRRIRALNPAFGEAHVVRGKMLYRNGRLKEAMESFHQAVAEDPSCTEAFDALAATLQEAGAPPELIHPTARVAAERSPHQKSVVVPVVQYLRDIGEEAESIRFATPLIRHQMAEAAKDEIGRFGIRILNPDVMLDRIGELAFQLDLHVKMKQLGWLPPCLSVLLAPSDRIVNRSFLDYWRRYVTVVEDPGLIARLKPLAERIPFNPIYVPLPDGRAMSKNRAFFAVQQEWQRQGRGPLLDLTRRHMERGREELRRMGVPDGAWFVSAHAREPGYMKEQGPSSEMGRNADIRTYVPAIEEITGRGGWVIRLGDASMRPLPKMERVVDYALSGFKSDWMDVYLTASCRFLFGVASGMSNVASVFGVPVGAGNFFPIGESVHSNRDVLIPKLVRDRASGRVLSFEECLALPLALTYDGQRLWNLGLETVDSEPEDIRTLAVEMLDRTGGTIVYGEDEEALQRRWDRLGEAFATGYVGGRVGRGFLARHRHLFRSALA